VRSGFSLRRRLLAAMLSVSALSVGATAAFYYIEIGAIGHDLRDRTLRSQAQVLLDSLRMADDSRVTFELPAEWAEAYSRPDASVSYTLYDASRHAILRSPNLDRDLPYSTPLERKAFGNLYFIGASDVAAISARAPEGYVLIVARADATQEALAWSLLEENLEYFGYILVPSVMVALILIWLICGWSLRPVTRASREAARIGPNTLESRIAVAGLPSEIRILVEAVNAALDRLADAYAAERRLTEDAAHELRTPLAVLSLRLQSAKLDRVIDWPTVERELAQMGRLVSQLLDLARKESAARTGAIDDAPVNLSRIVREAAAMILPLAEKANRTVDVEAPAAVAVHGRADDLRDMVRNLLDNALVHGQGTVRVRVRQVWNGKAQAAVIDVADDGPGLPEALREIVFERFHKGTAASPGAGLGLAIVRRVARMHQGEVGFLPGPGCRIRVSLPAALKPVTRSQPPATR
jgi:two-component system sensor histidine kinase QseC